jgi:hypothetical protein
VTCKRIFALAFAAASGAALGLMTVAVCARFIVLLLKGPEF